MRRREQGRRDWVQLDHFEIMPRYLQDKQLRVMNVYAPNTPVWMDLTVHFFYVSPTMELAFS